MERRAEAASKAPWQSFIEGRDHWAGDDFIRIGGLDDDEKDMYVSRERTPASDADLDFIAHARQDLPRLIAEVRRLRQPNTATDGD
ncbi:MAG: hypothetical protein H0X39_20060 [Actinobacteria bacterium]|nr:hypothetical protein [Actinomycetota bacterium]